MTAEQATLAGRREAEKLMITTVNVGYVTYTEDPVTYETIEVISPVYTGKARIRLSSPKANTVEAAGQYVAIQSLVLSLPIDGSASVGTSQVVIVTANPLDTALVGTKYRITGTSSQSHATARRFEIERNS
jgi:hypothetical protein